MKLFGISFALLAAGAANAVVMFDPDTFTSGSDEGWGSGAVHTVTTGGGPGGAGDRYLRVTGDGSTGPGGKMATKNNTANYIGNYTVTTANGVSGWFRNESNASITLRVVFWGNNGSRWTSTTGLVLSANSAWTNHTFGLNASSLTRVSGFGTWAEGMSDVYQVMIRNDVGVPSANGTQQAGTFGMDNIQVVPEPGTVAVLALGGLALLKRRKN